MDALLKKKEVFFIKKGWWKTKEKIIVLKSSAWKKTLWAFGRRITFFIIKIIILEIIRIRYCTS